MSSFSSSSNSSSFLPSRRASISAFIALISLFRFFKNPDVVFPENALETDFENKRRVSKKLDAKQAKTRIATDARKSLSKTQSENSIAISFRAHECPDMRLAGISVDLRGRGVELLRS